MKNEKNYKIDKVDYRKKKSPTFIESTIGKFYNYLYSSSIEERQDWKICLKSDENCKLGIDLPPKLKRFFSSYKEVNMVSTQSKFRKCASKIYIHSFGDPEAMTRTLLVSTIGYNKICIEYSYWLNNTIRNVSFVCELNPDGVVLD